MRALSEVGMGVWNVGTAWTAWNVFGRDVMGVVKSGGRGWRLRGGG